MINHARTLLLNVQGPHLENLGIPGDVYIPPFEPVALTSGLTSVRTILLGATPDYDGQVYRAAQYMGVLHSTEYAPYVYVNDSRITYDPDNLTVMDDALFAVLVSGDSSLVVTGTWADAGLDGRSVTTWKVTALTTTTVRVTNMVSGISVVYADNEVKILIGSDYRITFNTQPYTAGNQWYVTCRARPQPSLGSILATIRQLPVSVIDEVFGDKSQEPNKTFANLYNKHYAFPYQMSGFLFAYIKKLEDIRTHVV